MARENTMPMTCKRYETEEQQQSQRSSFLRLKSCESPDIEWFKPNFKPEKNVTSETTERSSFIRMLERIDSESGRENGSGEESKDALMYSLKVRRRRTVDNEAEGHRSKEDGYKSDDSDRVKNQSLKIKDRMKNAVRFKPIEENKKLQFY